MVYRMQSPKLAVHNLIVAGINLNNKDIIIVYDCDDAGREGAEQDAYTLQTEYGCRIKIVDLGTRQGRRMITLLSMANLKMIFVN